MCKMVTGIPALGLWGVLYRLSELMDIENSFLNGECHDAWLSLT